MRRVVPVVLFFTLLALIAIVVLLRTGRSPATADKERLTLVETLGGDAGEGFARAYAPRPFAFPADHGPHPGFRTEWWYFNGNLETAYGRHFGYQLTFFRVALAPQPPKRPSAWGTSQVYMAHFALTDARGGRFHAFERFSRAALGLAGSQAAPFRVWLEDWSAAAVDGGGDTFPLRLRATGGDVAIDLTLDEGKPVVLQGERGLSRKSDAPGNASYYYSLTRLPTAGILRVGGQTFAVRGLSWFDREWSTSVLSREEVGWDWFSLQLDDGRELMFYRLRRADGGASPWSRGTLVAADGSAHPLRVAEVVLDELGFWKSPNYGRYPSRWRLRVPAAGLDLHIEPWVAEQEWQGTVRYWEGAVQVRGAANGKPVAGNGYVELTGYGENGIKKQEGRDRFSHPALDR